jgi:acetoin utilization deacetylase AcuC-like enzyme
VKFVLKDSSAKHSPLVFDPLYKTDLRSFGLDRPFALDRGELVLAKLQEEWPQVTAHQPAPITDDDILSVHTAPYLKTLQHNETWLDLFELTAADCNLEIATRQLHEILDDFKLKAGGTKLAVELALETGHGANLGGGYHHAFPDRGRGYCAINDIAIAITSAMARGLARKVLIVDVDFHQGDGTALIFRANPNVFTLSVHSEIGWPDEKQESDLDVPIFEKEEHLYLQKLSEAVDLALKKITPDLVLYVAGSDPYEKDVLPGTRFIRLSLEQLKSRDEYAIDKFSILGIPLVMVFAGGYGPHVWEVHYWATRRLLERSVFLAGSQSHPHNIT